VKLPGSRCHSGFELILREIRAGQQEAFTAIFLVPKDPPQDVELVLGDLGTVSPTTAHLLYL